MTFQEFPIIALTSSQNTSYHKICYKPSETICRFQRQQQKQPSALIPPMKIEKLVRKNDDYVPTSPFFNERGDYVSVQKGLRPRRKMNDENIRPAFARLSSSSNPRRQPKDPERRSDGRRRMNCSAADQSKSLCRILFCNRLCPVFRSPGPQRSGGYVPPKEKSNEADKFGNLLRRGGGMIQLGFPLWNEWFA